MRNEKPEYCYHCGHNLSLYVVQHLSTSWLYENCYVCGTQICSTRVIDTPTILGADDYG